MLADLVVKKKLNVRDTEKLVSETINGKTVAKKVVKTKLSPQPRPTSGRSRTSCGAASRRMSRSSTETSAARSRSSITATRISPRSRTDGHPSRLIRKGGDVSIMKRLAPFFVLLFLLHSGCSEPAPAFNEADPLDAKVSGEKALAHVTALVGFGPRPAGSEALEQSRKYLEKELAASGWTTKRQTFKERPRGVRWSSRTCSRGSARTETADWDKPVAGVIGSHYDTKLYENFTFVGANDGGSSTGLLVELARTLAERPVVASRIELVFFDGEEAFGTNITSKDGLYGSRHYARSGF